MATDAVPFVGVCGFGFSVGPFPQGSPDQRSPATGRDHGPALLA